MDKTPTLADLARLADCSTATVSLALRNDPRVAAGRRVELQKLARDRGYTPNPALAALAARRWAGKADSRESVMAVLSVGLENSRLALGRNYHGEPDLVGAAGKRAKQLGYTVEYHRLHDHKTPETVKRILLARGISGLLLTGAHPTLALTAEFLAGFTSVMMGLTPFKRITHTVESDWAQGIKLAFSKLTGLGYRRIGVLLRPYSSSEKQEIILSRALLELNAQEQTLGPQPKVGLLGSDEARHPVEFRDWYAREKPDAIIASNGDVYRWLGTDSRGTAPAGPKPAFICLYNQGVATDPRMSCLRHNHGAEGSEAVELLDHLLRSRMVGLPRYPISIMVPPHWQEGDTTPPATSLRPPTWRKQKSRRTG